MPGFGFGFGFDLDEGGETGASAPPLPPQEQGDDGRLVWGAGLMLTWGAGQELEWGHA